MTIYGEILESVRDSIENALGKSVAFSVDVSAKGKGDLFSNVIKVCGEKIVFLEDIPYVESFYEECGFLNFILREEVFFRFLGQFDVPSEEGNTDVEKRIFAYIRLAENEKRFAGVEPVSMELSPEVRRAVLLLMKYIYMNETGDKNAAHSYAEVLRILDSLEAKSKNLKTFVITYEPLLLAVRGSLVKQN